MKDSLIYQAGSLPFYLDLSTLEEIEVLRTSYRVAQGSLAGRWGMTKKAEALTMTTLKWEQRQRGRGAGHGMGQKSRPQVLEQLTPFLDLCSSVEIVSISEIWHV